MQANEFTELVNRYGPALVLYARQWCYCPEDVVQTSFLKLVKQKNIPENLAGWLFQVVRNAAIDAGRSDQRRQKHELNAGKSLSQSFLPSENSSDLDHEEISTLLEKLPIEIREIVIAHIWGGLTFEQIADVLPAQTANGVTSKVRYSASTVFRRYNEGLDLLREKLADTVSQK